MLELTELELIGRDGIIKQVEGIGIMDLQEFNRAKVTMLRVNRYGIEYRAYEAGVPRVTFLHGGGRTLEVITETGMVIEIYNPAYNNLTNPNVLKVKFYKN